MDTLARRCPTFALRHVFATTPADAVVLLDADEFIDVPNRAALHAMIGNLTSPRRVPCLAWRNAVPDPLCEQHLRFGDELLVAPKQSIFRKIIVTRAVFEAAPVPLVVTPGNHMIDPSGGQPLHYETVGDILHLPLRSMEQMRRKTVMGALGHLARTDREPHEGYHRFDGLRRIHAWAIDERDVIGWAGYYGEPRAAKRRCTPSRLIQVGFVRRPLDVAHDTASEPVLPLPHGAWQFIAGLLLSWSPAPGRTMELELDGTTLRAKPGQLHETEATLTKVAALRAERDALKAENQILRASTSWRITAPLRAAARRLKT
jgi:hypothetical protein